MSPTCENMLRFQRGTKSGGLSFKSLTKRRRSQRWRSSDSKKVFRDKFSKKAADDAAFEPKNNSRMTFSMIFSRQIFFKAWSGLEDLRCFIPDIVFLGFTLFSLQLVQKYAMMSVMVFEPRISGVVSDRSTNWSTTAARWWRTPKFGSDNHGFESWSETFFLSLIL